MRFGSYLAAFALTLLVFTSFDTVQSASAQAVVPEEATTCAFSAWTSNKKPFIEVRGEPSDAAKIVGQIPTVSDAAEAQYAYSIYFDVKEARDGWLKIANASDAYNKESDDYVPREIYEGEGWIRSDEATIGIQSARGFLKPETESERLLDIGSDWLTEMGQINNILACREDWLLLDYTLLRKRLPSEQLVELSSGEQSIGRAWFRGLCSNAETTCDMKSVDP